MDEVVDQEDGRPHRAHHEHGHEPDRQQPELPCAARDLPGIAGDQRNQQHAFDPREHPARAKRQLVVQEERQQHRGEDGAHHRPPLLARDRWFGTFGVRRVSFHSWTPVAGR